MRVPVVAPGVLLAGTGLGGVLTVVTLLPGPVGLAAAIGVLGAGAFLLWPGAVLPVGIIGGAVVGALLSGGDVRRYIAVEVLLLAAGGAALAVRHWLGSRRHRDAAPDRFGRTARRPPRRHHRADGDGAGAIAGSGPVGTPDPRYGVGYWVR
ncbi:hypothetical protein ACQRWP_12760 [Micromonospora trifolii]|uniref:hypothetical protein n=1 Tax=Micromonospora trifolii TaxID=2911208 RepID=UPI003D2F28C7